MAFAEAPTRRAGQAQAMCAAKFKARFIAALGLERIDFANVDF